MEHDIKIAVIGGDTRQQAAASLLASEGYEVAVYGIDSGNFGNATKCDELKSALGGAEYVVLPLPYTADKQNINMPLSEKKLGIKELCDMLGEQTVLAGMAKGLDEYYSGKIIDYFESEELQIRNAVPTAEGAIAIAMEAMPLTIHGSSLLVLGYGRIAKVLAPALKALGAKVSVAARKAEALAWCEVEGFTPHKLEELSDIIGGFDVVFNTIPEKILDDSILAKCRADTVIIDLASKPGGVDFEAAKVRGKNVIWALSLPGKVAPLTAGEIIKKSIEVFLKN